MNTKRKFITEITREYINSYYPQEKPVVEIVINELSTTDFDFSFATAKGNPMGLGIGELVDTLKSPIIIAALSSLWSLIIAPLLKDLLAKKIVTNNEEKVKNGAVLEKAIQDYLKKEGRKAGLSKEDAVKLAEKTSDWVKKYYRRNAKIKRLV